MAKRRQLTACASWRLAGGLGGRGRLLTRSGTEAASGVLGRRSGLKGASVGKGRTVVRSRIGIRSVLATIPLPTGMVRQP